MSYILEALKKSGEDRARLTAADTRPVAAVATIPAGSGIRSSRPAWPWLAAAGLTGLALLAIFIMSGTSHNEPRPDRAAQPERASTNPAPTSAPPEPSGKEGTAPAVQTATTQLQPAPQAAPEKRDMTRSGKPSAVQAVKLPPAAAPRPAPTPAAVPVQTASAEMPQELLRQVLAVPVMAHMYSGKPSERMIIVDGRAAREGEMLAPGMTIEQITPSGIVVLYQGYRARKPVH